MIFGLLTAGLKASKMVHSAHVAQQAKIEVDQAEAKRIAAIPFRNVIIDKYPEFVELCTDLVSGTLHATRCQVHIRGEFGQMISKAYNSLYKVRALRRRGEIGAVSSALEVGASIVEGNVVAPIKYIMDQAGEEVYLDDQFRAALCLPSADYACVALVSGLHLSRNDGTTVVLTATGRNWHPPMPL